MFDRAGPAPAAGRRGPRLSRPSASAQRDRRIRHGVGDGFADASHRHEGSHVDAGSVPYA